MTTDTTKTDKRKRGHYERKVAAFRVRDAEHATITKAVTAINAEAKARGVSPFLNSDVLRAAVLDWLATRNAAQAGQGVAAHLGEEWPTQPRQRPKRAA